MSTKFKTIVLSSVPETAVSKPYRKGKWTTVIQLQLNRRTITTLVDSGARNSLLIRQDSLVGSQNESKLQKLKKNLESMWQYVIPDKNMHKALLHSPHFPDSRKITWEFYKAKTKEYINSYDCILGRDILKALYLKIDFDKNHLMWDNISIPMKDCSAVQKNYLEKLMPYSLTCWKAKSWRRVEEDKNHFRC